MTRRNKELRKSLGYSWPNQRPDHLGRAIDGIRTRRWSGLRARGCTSDVCSTMRGRSSTCWFSAGQLLSRSMRSGNSIYTREDARGFLTVGEIFRENCRQDDFFVPHPPQLKADLHGKDQRRPKREELHYDADCRNFLGEVERVADDPVHSRGDELPRLGHDAEGLAQLRQHNNGKCAADERQQRGYEARDHRQIATREDDDSSQQKCADQRGYPRLDSARLP